MDFRKKIALCGIFGFALLAGAGVVQAGALGAPFIVNGSTPVDSKVPLDVTAGSGGDQAILFQDATLGGRYVRRYDSNGVALTSVETALGPYGEAVAVDRVGNHVVVETVPGLPGIYARIFNRAGAAIVNQYRLDTNTGGQQSGPVVAMNGDGVFAVTWTSYYSSTSTQYVQTRLFNPNGTARSAMLNVASATNTFIAPTGISVDGTGNAAIVWQQRDFSTPIGMSVWLRRYNSVGSALSSATQMNMGTDQAIYPHVSTNTEGALVATWSKYSAATDSRVIMAQRYTAAGAAAGGNFVVSSTMGNGQYQDVGMMDDGSFAVVWDNDNRYHVPSAIPTIYGRQYDSAGNAVAPELPISDGVASAFFAVVGMDLAGNFTASWRQYNPATAKMNVYARRYRMDTLPPITVLANQVPQGNFSGAAGSFQYFKFTIPAGTANFNLTMTGAGNADILLRYGALPTASIFDVSPGLSTSNESLLIGSPPAGDFYVAVWGSAAYSNVSLIVSY